MFPLKPISEKQLLANRLNAQKSTGPQSEEGKRISSLNALTHGLTGQTLVMTPAEGLRYEQFTNEYMAALQPETIVEADLAESIAQGAYRLKRATGVEHNIFALGHPSLLNDPNAPVSDHPEIDSALANARAFLADAKQFQLLTLYEQRIKRNMQQDVARLEKLQAERKAAREAALEDAKLLAEANYAEGKSYDPAPDFPPENGFVFSTAEINASIRRRRRLEAAVESRFAQQRRSKETKTPCPELIDLAQAA